MTAKPCFRRLPAEQTHDKNKDNKNSSSNNNGRSTRSSIDNQRPRARRNSAIDKTATTTRFVAVVVKKTDTSDETDRPTDRPTERWTKHHRSKSLRFRRVIGVWRVHSLSVANLSIFATAAAVAAVAAVVVGQTDGWEERNRNGSRTRKKNGPQCQVKSDKDRVSQVSWSCLRFSLC